MKKIILFLLSAVLLFLILLAGFIVLAPWLLNRPYVKDRITAALSERLGGPVTYEHAGLSILPRPHLAILGSLFSIPRRLSGSLESLDLYADLRPLLRGKLVITTVGLDRPDIGITISGRKEVQGEKKTLTDQTPESAAAAALGAAALRVANIDFTIRNGRLTLMESGQKLLTLDRLDASVSVPPFEKGDATVESIAITGEVQGVLSDVDALPGPMTFSVGHFKADPRSISFADAMARLLDASFIVSGKVEDYLTALHTADLTVRGTAGPETLQWIRTMTSQPPEMALRAPVTFAPTRFIWRHDGSMDLSGTATVPNGPEIAFEVSRTPERIHVKKLLIRDDLSRAELTLDLEKRRMIVTFDGNLNRETLTGLFEQERFRFGWIRGNVSARVALDQPMESTIRGALEGEGMVPPIPLPAPVWIDRFSMKAAGRAATLDPLVITTGERTHTVTGSVAAAADGWRIDLKTDDLEWDRLKPLFSGGGETAPGGPSETKESSVPVRVNLRLNADSFSAVGWTARPFIGEIRVRPEGVEVKMNEARICGMNFTGAVSFHAPETILDLNAAAKGQPLEPALSCFSGKDLRVSGTYDFSGSFKSRGEKGALLNALQGEVAIKAKDGKIFHDLAVIKVLQYLTTTELLKGKLPDPQKNGLSYTRWSGRGKIENGVFEMEEMVLKSHAVAVTGRGSFDLSKRTMDAVYLVAPFTTADSVVKHVPLLKDVLGGSILTIPARVRGPFEDPTVTPLPPEEVAAELGGMMKRILSLPFKLIEPVIPKSGPKPEKKEPAER